MFLERLKPCFLRLKNEKEENADSDIKTEKAEIKQVVKRKRAGKNRASMIENLLCV